MFFSILQTLFFGRKKQVEYTYLFTVRRRLPNGKSEAVWEQAIKASSQKDAEQEFKQFVLFKDEYVSRVYKIK